MPARIRGCAARGALHGSCGGHPGSHICGVGPSGARWADCGPSGIICV